MSIIFNFECNGCTSVFIYHCCCFILVDQEHDCQLSWDIVDLIDREVDLMAHSVKARNLEGLRRRICILFLQYIKTPAFNPKAAKLLKVSREPRSESERTKMFTIFIQKKKIDI